MAEKMDGTRVTTTPGFIVVETDGKSTQYPIDVALRAADIPALTYSQVATISTLANLVVVLIRTLIDKGVLDESFVDSLGMGIGLDQIQDAVSAMGGSYGEPDLSQADA